MRSAVALAAMLLLACAGDPTNADENERALRPHVLAPKEAFVCGPTCLFALLRLSGRRIDLPAIINQFSESELRSNRGVSLARLRQVAEANGLACEIRRCTDDDLRVLSIPVITLVEQGPKPGKPAVGHFIVITAAGVDSLTTIDGTIGKLQSWPWSFYQQIKTGYVLMPVQRHSTTFRAVGISVLAWMSLLTWLVVPRRRRASRNLSTQQVVEP